MVDKSLLSMPSIGSNRTTASPSPSSASQSQLNLSSSPKNAIDDEKQIDCAVEESSESENEAEPGCRVFQRRVSTTKTLNGSVSKKNCL